MAGTHFKGAVKFSSATPALQNLNIGNWPDQVYYMDDFLDHVLNIGGAAGNFWSLINATNCPTTLATLGNDGSLNGEAASILAGAANDGTLIQSNMNYSTPSTKGNRLYFECRTNRQLYATAFTRTAAGASTSQIVAGTQSGAVVAYDAFPATGTAAQRMGMTWDIIATIAAANTLTSDYFMASQDRGITYAPTN